jgi:myosin heavy subunit
MESNKRFLGVKIRKQVRDLISEMSNNTDLHFIRCIKPNEMKKGFTFVDKVCYNQIKYLGILDTIQMRKDSYHIRQYYSQFYLKYGILERNLPTLIAMSEGKISPLDAKDITVKFITNHFVNYTLEYQFGKEKLFLKMSTQNFFDNLLANRTKNIVTAATLIKAHYKRSKFAKERKLHKSNVPKIQRAVRRFLLVAR